MRSIRTIFLVVCLMVSYSLQNNDVLQSAVNLESAKLMRHFSAVGELEEKGASLIYISAQGAQSTPAPYGNPWATPVDRTIPWIIIGCTLAMSVAIIIGFTLWSICCNTSPDKRKEDRMQSQLSKEINDELASRQNLSESPDVWAWNRSQTWLDGDI